MARQWVSFDDEDPEQDPSKDAEPTGPALLVDVLRD